MVIYLNLLRFSLDCTLHIARHISSRSGGPLFTLRDSQIQVFNQLAVEDFKDRATVYLFEVYPEECDELGFDEVRDVVRYGIDVTAAYGITRQFLVLLYLELMFEYGVDFDQDEALPWAQAILSDTSLSEDQAVEALSEHLPSRDEDEDEGEENHE
jgi:hypothetical protein